MDQQELINKWGKVREGTIWILDQVDDQQLAYAPKEWLWSFGRTVRHIAEIESGWIGHVLEGRLDDWPIYTAPERDTTELCKGLLARTHSESIRCLAGLRADEWSTARKMKWDETLSPADIAWHVMQHEMHHRGEISLMLGLLGLEGWQA